MKNLFKGFFFGFSIFHEFPSSKKQELFGEQSHQQIG